MAPMVRHPTLPQTPPRAISMAKAVAIILTGMAIAESEPAHDRGEQGVPENPGEGGPVRSRRQTVPPWAPAEEELLENGAATFRRVDYDVKAAAAAIRGRDL